MKNHDLHTKKLLYIILKIYYTRNYLKHVLNVSDKRQLLEYLLNILSCHKIKQAYCIFLHVLNMPPKRSKSMKSYFVFVIDSWKLIIKKYIT